MPRDLERGAHGAKRAATSRLDSALAGQGQHGPLKPGREPPSCQNEGVPVPTNAFKCHGLVSEECSWGGVRKAGRGLGEFMVDCSAEGAEEFGPEGPGGSSGWRLGGEVLKGLGDVGATVTAFGGSLIRTELGFYLGPYNGGDVRAEEPS